MNRRDFLAASLTGAAALAFPRSARAQGRKPNVILVMTDDQGYGDVAALGNPDISTPNLDWLHAHSTRLTNFHVDPTCSPTRSALVTGRYSTRTGVWHTIMGRSMLHRKETTFGDVFAASGYATGMFGKWHLGDNYPFRPEDRGFQEVLRHGGGGVGQTPDFWGNKYFDDTYWHNGVPTPYKGYCTDVWFDGAMAFMEANKDRPFFAYIPTNAPHGPYLVAEKYSKPYKDKGVKGARANFYGMITNIDENKGRLQARIKQLGIEDDTILIFMTDNGTSAGAAGGMRGRKGSEYEGGHRVPFFIRWPKSTIQEGRDIDTLTAHIDVLPTLIELCGLEKPAVEFDGASLAALVRGAKPQWPDRTLFVHSQRVEHPQKWRKCAVMTQKWRLVNGKELYDIAADPEQKKDVAAEHPAVVEKLRKAYDAWWASLEPEFAKYCNIVLGTEHELVARLTAHDWHEGNPPWNQGLIRNPKTKGNGFWAVEVAKAGTYAFTLTRLPLEAKGDILASKARLKLGDVEVSKDVPAGATAVTLEAKLPAGPGKLTTYLTDPKTGQERGAFFVYVERK